MTPFRKLTETFAVAPQLSEDDIARAKAEGYAAIVNNRPDGEAPEALQAEGARAAAEAAGLVYYEAPFSGPPTLEAVELLETLFASPSGPILAYCRSGTRSTTAWAFAQARSGLMGVEEILRRAGEAGYDLSPHRESLRRLAEG